MKRENNLLTLLFICLGIMVIFYKCCNDSETQKTISDSFRIDTTYTSYMHYRNGDSILFGVVRDCVVVIKNVK